MNYPKIKPFLFQLGLLLIKPVSHCINGYLHYQVNLTSKAKDREKQKKRKIMKKILKKVFPFISISDSRRCETKRTRKKPVVTVRGRKKRKLF